MVLSSTLGVMIVITGRREKSPYLEASNAFSM